MHDQHRAPHPAHAQPGMAGAGPRPERPPRERHNFDEVQPQSNANAMPFAHARSAASGGRAQGYGGDARPRHRGGAPAHKAAHGAGKAQGPGRRANRRRRQA